MVLRLRVVVAPLVGERGFPSTQPSVAAAHALSRAAPRLRSRGPGVGSVRGLPRPGIESASPALAGEFFTTEPPGKSKEGNICP